MDKIFLLHFLITEIRFEVSSLFIIEVNYKNSFKMYGNKKYGVKLYGVQLFRV